ncbi:MAG: ECF transporter S component [Synergistaceae bacterium]|jgi:riboflavin transporter FmnP|nr:ECF transporter S component [Synergistaceae bacterium]
MLKLKSKSVSLGVRGLTTTALLATVASILMFIDFALPIFPSFLKMDFSEVPGLLAAIAVGPYSGIMVELVKNLINLPHTTTGGVGEFASFTIGSALVIPAGVLYRRSNTNAGAALALLAGVTTMTAAAALANYYVLLPLYGKLVPIDTILAMYSEVNPYVDTVPKLILTSIVPFNIIKGTVITLISFALYKRLRRILSGR